MRLSRRGWLWSFGALLLASAALGVHHWLSAFELWALLEQRAQYVALEVQHPIPGVLMPANMPAPALLWKTNAAGIDRWVAGFKAGGRRWLFDGVRPMWRPPEADWRRMKQAANGEPIELILAGSPQDNRRTFETRNPFAQFDLGEALRNQGDLSNAVLHLREAVRLLPDGSGRQYDAAEMNFTLAEAYYGLSLYPESVPVLEQVLRRNAGHAGANYMMAMAKAWLGETDATFPYYERAIRSDPQLAAVPNYYDVLGRNYVKKGLYADGLKASEQACRLAVQAGRPKQAAVLRERVEQCRRLLARAKTNSGS
jgi:tetratricopeptide (TPR) repeat protein